MSNENIVQIAKEKMLNSTGDSYIANFFKINNA